MMTILERKLLMHMIDKFAKHVNLQCIVPTDPEVVPDMPRWVDSNMAIYFYSGLHREESLCGVNVDGIIDPQRANDVYRINFKWGCRDSKGNPDPLDLVDMPGDEGAEDELTKAYYVFMRKETGLNYIDPDDCV